MVTSQSPGQKTNLVCGSDQRSEWRSSEKDARCQDMCAREWHAGQAGRILISFSRRPSISPEGVWHGLACKQKHRFTPEPSQTDIQVLLICRVFVKILSALFLDVALKNPLDWLCTTQAYCTMFTVCLKESTFLLLCTSPPYSH